MTVCCVISSVLKLYWQYSALSLQSSVTFCTLTTSLVLQAGTVVLTHLLLGSSVTVLTRVQFTPCKFTLNFISLYIVPEKYK